MNAARRPAAHHAAHGEAGEEAQSDRELGGRDGDGDRAAGRDEAVPVERRPPCPEARDLRDRGDGEKRAKKRRERDGDHGHPRSRLETGADGPAADDYSVDSTRASAASRRAATSSTSASEITSGGASMSASMCSVPTGVGHE